MVISDDSKAESAKRPEEWQHPIIEKSIDVNLHRTVKGEEQVMLLTIRLTKAPDMEYWTMALDLDDNQLVYVDGLGLDSLEAVRDFLDHALPRR